MIDLKKNLIHGVRLMKYSFIYIGLRRCIQLVPIPLPIDQYQ